MVSCLPLKLYYKSIVVYQIVVNSLQSCLNRFISKNYYIIFRPLPSVQIQAKAKTHYATYHENVALKIEEELLKTGILLMNVFFYRKEQT